MPIYNAQILKIDAAETRRYAGLKKAANFDEKNIYDACEEALLLLNVRGIYKGRANAEQALQRSRRPLI